MDAAHGPRPVRPAAARSVGATALAALLAGACLAVLQPLPYIAVRVIFGIGTPTDDANTAAVRSYTTAPDRWLAVAAFALTLAILLLRVRSGGASGHYVGAVVAASVGAYVTVGAVALGVAAGDGDMAYAALWFVVSSVGAIMIALVVAGMTCWWMRGFR